MSDKFTENRGILVSKRDILTCTIFCRNGDLESDVALVRACLSSGSKRELSKTTVLMSSGGNLIQTQIARSVPANESSAVYKIGRNVSSSVFHGNIIAP